MQNSAKLSQDDLKFTTNEMLKIAACTISVLHSFQPGVGPVLHDQGQGSGYTCCEVPDSAHQPVAAAFYPANGRNLFRTHPARPIARKKLSYISQ